MLLSLTLLLETTLRARDGGYGAEQQRQTVFEEEKPPVGQNFGKRPTNNIWIYRFTNWLDQDLKVLVLAKTHCQFIHLP